MRQKKVRYKIDPGPATGIGGPTADDEFEIFVDAEEFIHGEKSEYYNVVGGVLTPMTTEEAAGIDSSMYILREKKRIADERFAMETADVEYDGHKILNGREDRALMESAMEKIRRGIATSIRWKCRDSYLDLTADNIDAIELLGLQQIQTAFAWEEAQIALLEGE